jgi:acyl-coenzyme A thioesterase PaaI-like protein
MPGFEPADPDFDARVRASLARQRVMALIGATLSRIAPGQVELDLPFSPELTQQRGFAHGGVIASLLDAARAEGIRAVGRVRRAGRTVTFAEGEAVALDGARQVVVATTPATLMTIVGRAGVRH